jgi:hypothetical protein
VFLSRREGGVFFSRREGGVFLSRREGGVFLSSREGGVFLSRREGGVPLGLRPSVFLVGQASCWPRQDAGSDYYKSTWLLSAFEPDHV